MAMQGLYKRYIDLEGLCLTGMPTFFPAVLSSIGILLWPCIGSITTDLAAFRVSWTCANVSCLYNSNPWKTKRSMFTAMWLENHKTIYWIVEFADDFYFLEAVLVVFIFRVFSRQREREIQDGSLNNRWEYPLAPRNAVAVQATSGSHFVTGFFCLKNNMK